MWLTGGSMRRKCDYANYLDAISDEIGRLVRHLWPDGNGS